MYLLYLDDSGSVENANEKYLVLGGVCVNESQVHHFTTELDKIAERLRPSDPEVVEFHASVIFSGREEPWKSLTRPERQNIIKDVLGVLTASYDSARAFAVVVHKASCPSRNPMEVAFEEICSRFDKFLLRPEINSRGLIILDESTHATRLEQLARRFRKLGTSWDAIRRIVDGPLFVSSRSFRCVQLADHVAYAVFRRYEAKDTNYFDVFAHRFDRIGPLICGLQHVEADTVSTCLCPACLSRAANRPPPARTNGA